MWGRKLGKRVDQRHAPSLSGSREDTEVPVMNSVATSENINPLDCTPKPARFRQRETRYTKKLYIS